MAFPSVSDLSRREALQRLLIAGAAPAFLRHARAADVPRFALGVASGSPAADSIVLWTRLTGELPASDVPVQWELAADEAFKQIVARGEEPARADEAHSVHAQPRGLAPARWYWYRLSALGAQSAVGRTRTAPAPDAAVEQLDFAIASCQRWDHGHYAAWRDAARQELDLVLFLGDYIYEYPSLPFAGPRSHEGGVCLTLAQYRARYAQYKSDAALQAAHAACPWIVIWDDHEVENDYAGVQGQLEGPVFLARRAAAYRAWWEHMPLPRALKPSDEGAATIHGRLDWGRLARLHWIDDRQFRDPQACPRPVRTSASTVRLRDCPPLVRPERQLLGAAQERWLAEGWSTAHRWNLLAQQTLMARSSRDPLGQADAEVARDALLPEGRYWTDGWDGYPAARERLLGVLHERRVAGAVVLGGDVHANYVADLRVSAANDKSPLVATEFCGTSITSRGAEQGDVETRLAANPHLRYGRSDQRGYVRFRLRGDQLNADLRTVADAADPASAVSSSARFVVQAARPGAERVQ